MNIIYTAIFSDYDDLKEPRVITPGWEYIVFTDKQIESRNWKVIQVPLIDNNPQLTARYYKLNFHVVWPYLNADDKRTIWIDGSFIINCDLNAFWFKNFKFPFSSPAHPLRDCVYLEAEACIKNKRSNEESIQKHIDKYKAEGIPAHNGMISSGILLRFATDTRVTDFCEKWWNELKENSIRDQISFAKINFQMPNICHKFAFDYRTSEEFLFITHIHRRKIKDDSHLRDIDGLIRKRRRTRPTGNKWY